MAEVRTSVLHAQIEDALHHLRIARTRCAHSPNADTELVVELAECTLNHLLELQHAMSS